MLATTLSNEVKLCLLRSGEVLEQTAQGGDEVTVSGDL